MQDNAFLDWATTTIIITKSHHYPVITWAHDRCSEQILGAASLFQTVISICTQIRPWTTNSVLGWVSYNSSTPVFKLQIIQNFLIYTLLIQFLYTTPVNLKSETRSFFNSWPIFRNNKYGNNVNESPYSSSNDSSTSLTSKQFFPIQVLELRHLKN